MTPQRRRRPRCRMTNGASGRSSCMDPIRTYTDSNPEHSAPPGRPPGSPDSPSRRLTLSDLTPAAAMSAKPETLRNHSKTLGLVHRPHEPTQKPRGGHHRTNSAHGSALPSAHDSHADDRDVHGGGHVVRANPQHTETYLAAIGSRTPVLNVPLCKCFCERQIAKLHAGGGRGGLQWPTIPSLIFDVPHDFPRASIPSCGIEIRLARHSRYMCSVLLLV